KDSNSWARRWSKPSRWTGCRWCTNCWNSRAAEATGDGGVSEPPAHRGDPAGSPGRAEALIRGPGRRGGGCCQLGRDQPDPGVQPGASLQFVKAFADDGEDVNATDLHGRNCTELRCSQHGLWRHRAMAVHLRQGQRLDENRRSAVNCVTWS
uniref:ANK_REP_REGION domain-containing protein n=1 Tax=Macrostomum lignano TaxID=282301 RepID=A0A1I8F5W0_9PLAT